jgi:ATP-dependent Lon protease
MTTTSAVLPLLALRNEVRYVDEFGPLFVGRPASRAAARIAEASAKQIVVAAQRNDAKDPGPDDMHLVGVACALVQLREEEDGSLRLMLDGRLRVRITRIVREDSLIAEVTEWPDEPSSIPNVLRCARAVQSAFDAARSARGLPEEASKLLSVGWRPDLPDADRPHSRASSLVYQAQRYLDFENPVFPLEIRQRLLEAPSLMSRLELLEQQLRALAKS